jgi:hypothetical protein
MPLTTVMGWVVAFPGIAPNATAGCNRSRADRLVLSADKILSDTVGEAHSEITASLS